MGQEQSWSKEVDHSAELSSCHEESDSVQGEKIVSFQSELPLPLHQPMAAFIERCPNWDQYRLIQAALAGFLVQNGVDSRELTRLYVGNMFRRDSLRHGV